MVMVQTQIQAVTVYPDRARVTRVGQAAPADGVLESGLHVLEVGELPLTLLPESVRATARGTARAQLRGVQVQRSFYSTTPTENVRQLEQEIEALQDQLSGMDSQAERARQNRNALLAVLSQADMYATALAAGEMSLERQAELFQGLAGQVEAADTELQKLAVEKRALERELARLKNQLDQQRSARPRERYSARVEVEISQPGDLRLEFTYMVANASWRPLYDARLLEKNEKPTLELAYLAEVTQRSGEAWEEVSFTLSTARPALAGRVPELDPWYVQPVRQPPRPVASEGLTTAAMNKAVMAAPAAPAAMRLHAKEELADVLTAEVENAGASVSYHIPGQVGIPSDGAPHKVVVANASFSPQLDYVSAPKLVQAAYRRARLNNESPYLLLPGRVNLFAGDEYLGSTELELTPPQSELEFFLGIDDRLRIERELTRREMDKSIIGGKRRIHYTYEIKLENLLPSEARLVLQDQLPVGRHEDIRVKPEAIEPRPSEHTELNLLKWEFVLAPKEKRTVRFSFSVEFPQGMDVTGLP